MRVLIADDDRMVCEILANLVRECRHEVAGSVSGGGLAVLQSFATLHPDLTLLDVYMPRCNGLTICHALLSRDPGARVVLMSGLARAEDPFVSACRAAGFLRKPIRLEDMRRLLNPPRDNLTS